MSVVIEIGGQFRIVFRAFQEALHPADDPDAAFGLETPAPIDELSFIARRRADIVELQPPGERPAQPLDNSCSELPKTPAVTYGIA